MEAVFETFEQNFTPAQPRQLVSKKETPGGCQGFRCFAFTVVQYYPKSLRTGRGFVLRRLIDPNADSGTREDHDAADDQGCIRVMCRCHVNF